MFGYLLADRWVLPLCEDVLYRAFYCGVCRALRGDMGQRGRLTLSYDAAFLAILADAVREEPARMVRIHCPAHPRARPAMEGPALGFAARTQAVLFAGKIDDDRADDRRFRAWAARAALFPRIGRATRFPEYGDVAAMLEKQRAVEAQAGDMTLDRAADPFSAYMAGVAASIPELGEADRESARWLGYHVGKWIYLCDAAEDFDEDRRRGQFNPLHRYPSREAAADACGFLMTQCGAQSMLALELLPLRRHEGLLTNILTDGMSRMSEAILAGKGVARGKQSLSGLGRLAGRLP